VCFSQPSLSRRRFSSGNVHVHGIPSISAHLIRHRVAFSELKKSRKRELRRSVGSPASCKGKITDVRVPAFGLSSWVYCDCRLCCVWLESSDVDPHRILRRNNKGLVGLLTVDGWWMKPVRMRSGHYQASRIGDLG